MRKIFILLLSFSFTLAYSQNALNFDGVSDYVQMPSAGPIGTANRTVELWIKTSSSVSNQQVIVDWGSITTGNRFTLNLINYGKIRIEVGGSGFNTTTSVADGNWHHVAVTYDNAASSKYSIYLDGVLSISQNLTTAINTSNTNGIILGRRNDAINYFNGSMNEVRIWNVARTASQIQSSMNSQFCDLPTGLMYYYQFNQGVAGGSNNSVSTLNDAVANNDGTLYTFGLSGTVSNWVLGKPLSSGNTLITLNPQACQSYTSPSGNHTWTSSGIYYDTLTNSLGCDTVFTINLTVSATTYDSITTSACNSFQSPSGNFLWTTSGIYNDTIVNQQSCDSVITFFLSIQNIDTTVTQNGIQLTANMSGANYQWLDCNAGNSIIPGATAQTYIPSLNGNYAVEISMNNCVDTSFCNLVNTININELSIENPLSIFPNPATNVLNIHTLFPKEELSVELVDLFGKIVFSQRYVNSDQYQLNLNLPPSIYFLRIVTNKQLIVSKLIVK
jgi:hypothetical protein